MKCYFCHKYGQTKYHTYKGEYAPFCAKCLLYITNSKPVRTVIKRTNQDVYKATTIPVEVDLEAPVPQCICRSGLLNLDCPYTQKEPFGSLATPT